MIPRVFGTVGAPLKLKGTAYDFGHRIASLEFTLDHGETWTAFETPETNDYQNITWSFIWQPEAEGQYVLEVRSKNDAGKTSPENDHIEICIEVE